MPAGKGTEPSGTGRRVNQSRLERHSHSLDLSASVRARTRGLTRDHFVKTSVKLGSYRLASRRQPRIAIDTWVLPVPGEQGPLLTASQYPGAIAAGTVREWVPHGDAQSCKVHATGTRN